MVTVKAVMLNAEFVARTGETLPGFAAPAFHCALESDSRQLKPSGNQGLGSRIERTYPVSNLDW